MKLNSSQVDTDVFVEELPQLRRLDGPLVSHGKRTCVVGVLGFEPRCYAAVSQLARLGWHADCGFCVHYSHANMRESNEKHKDKMYSAMKAIVPGKGPVPIQHDDHDFGSDCGDILLSALAEHGFDVESNETAVVFDITVGSSRLLLESLHALLNSGVDLTLLYSEATDYRPSFKEYRQFADTARNMNLQAPEFLTIGVDQVELLRRIPGRCADARPTYLVAFPSFNPIRIDAVLEELAPNRVHWLFGVPHLVRNRWRIDAQIAYHRSLRQHLHRHCYISTFDYRETLSVLESIYRKRMTEYNVLVCSLGSKLQKLGQALFHILRPEVGAVVCVPKQWEPDRYSDDKPRAVYALELGHCQRIRQLLWRSRTLCP